MRVSKETTEFFCLSVNQIQSNKNHQLLGSNCRTWASQVGTSSGGLMGMWWTWLLVLEKLQVCCVLTNWVSTQTMITDHRPKERKEEEIRVVWSKNLSNQWSPLMSAALNQSINQSIIIYEAPNCIKEVAQVTIKEIPTDPTTTSTSVTIV